jgi:cell fate (sporulation/competence/biofilm development) regulator YmcA (YheA/YmcA/DUF963 family)
MPRNNLITLLGAVDDVLRTELTTTTGNQVERPTNKPIIEKKINYKLLFKMVESAIEEILLEYPNDPVVEEFKKKIITNLQPVIKQIIQE